MPLIPNSQRTHKELSDMGRKGGLKAAENRKRRLEHATVTRNEMTEIKRDLSFLIYCLLEITEEGQERFMIERKRDQLKGTLRRLNMQIEDDTYNY